jgi:hypothetical protein
VQRGAFAAARSPGALVAPATTSAAAAASSTATTTAAAVTATGAIFAWPRFVDGQRTTIVFLSVEPVDGSLCL